MGANLAPAGGVDNSRVGVGVRDLLMANIKQSPFLYKHRPHTCARCCQEGTSFHVQNGAMMSRMTQILCDFEACMSYFPTK